MSQYWVPTPEGIRRRLWRSWRRLGGDGSALIDIQDDNAEWPRADQVVTIAHNAGDDLTATALALDHGAAIIEMDVVESGGQLYAGHRKPLPRVGPRLSRRPTLVDSWVVSAPAAVMLDLKEASPCFLDLLFAFLAEHGEGRLVILVSGRPATLAAFRRRMPGVVRLYGASPPGRLDAFLRDETLIELVDGVNLRHERIDPALGQWANARGLWLVAWTVNDFKRARELIEMGVDALTTDNLAIMEKLRGDIRVVPGQKLASNTTRTRSDNRPGPCGKGRE